MDRLVSLTMAAGATTSDITFVPPTGSRVSSIRIHTPVTITGSPTNINATVGKTAGGAEYVASVDCKGFTVPTATTLVGAPDYSSWVSGQAICCQIAAVGGTNPAGTVNFFVSYQPPNP